MAAETLGADDLDRLVATVRTRQDGGDPEAWRPARSTRLIPADDAIVGWTAVRLARTGPKTVSIAFTAPTRDRASKPVLADGDHYRAVCRLGVLGGHEGDLAVVAGCSCGVRAWRDAAGAVAAHVRPLSSLYAGTGLAVVEGTGRARAAVEDGHDLVRVQHVRVVAVVVAPTWQRSLADLRTGAVRYLADPLRLHHLAVEVTA